MNESTGFFNHPHGSPAAIVVAASNSMWKDKADIVCAGVDDQEQIQAAIDALPPGGGRVELLDGRFNISMPIKIAKKCRLIGQGDHSVLFLARAPVSLLSSGAGKGQPVLNLVDAVGFRAQMQITIVGPENRTAMNIQSVGDNKLVLDGNLPVGYTAQSRARVWATFPLVNICGADGVVLRNLAIDGNRKEQVVFEFIGDSYTKGGTGFYEACHAIHVCDGSKNITIKNCRIYNTQAEGILANNAGPNLTFAGNRLEDIGDKGICIVRTPGPGIISGNYIRGTGKSANFVPHTHIWGWGDCVNVHPPSGAGWVITNNIFQEALRSGIRATGCSHSIISNNFVSDCGDSGIIVNARHQNTIAGNSVFRNADGITIAFASRVNCQNGGTIVTGNIIDQNRRNGVMFCGARHSLIQGNTITNNGRHGIFITNRAYDISQEQERWPEYPVRGGGNPDRIIVSSNIVSGNSQAKDKSCDNIHVNSSSNILVAGNICDGGESECKPGCDLRVLENCREVTVKDNRTGTTGE